ncbi:MAG: FAD-dependent oxidoreductase, partial [Gammaproteobacteria bacterium]|nr:FAD-dependent oxidoreductase [Gammaproteobacteria bacterium]
MKNNIIEMLTSHDTPKDVCVMGNEGVARAAIETGVSGVFAYPGTPSTEISMVFSKVQEFQSSTNTSETHPELSQNKIYFEYSINEKIALEKAIASAIGSKSALACMKNVGLNVALDALMTIPYQTINAPLVLIICDDPGCHSSSNEQDSRYFAIMASVPLLDPSSPEEAYEMTKQAFVISAELKLPVIVRLTTRISHGRGAFTYHCITDNQSEGFFPKEPININVPARTAVAHQNLLKKLEEENLQPYCSQLNHSYINSSKELAIISSGIAVTYLKEQIALYDLSEQFDYLKIGIIHPFPEQDVLDFLKQGYKKVLILEELEPILENGTRIVAQKNAIAVEILGKQSYGLTTVGEYSLSKMHDVLEQFLGKTLSDKNLIVQSKLADFTKDLPIRPPALCVGCPHRATYYAMKLVLPSNHQDLILCGDIGCLGLGALPPLKMMDTVNHMGMSISMAQGLEIAVGKDNEGNHKNKIIALIGDGTFFHSGIVSLLNAVYTKANISVIIFDNRTIAMTGMQVNPGTDKSEEKDYDEIDLETLLYGMGIKFVESMDPFDLKDTYQKLRESINYQGVSVLISKSPCVILDSSLHTINKPLVVDHTKCKTCANHDDESLHCSQLITTGYGLARARAKMTASEHIPGPKQSCPANICNHGFFNAILADDHQTALEIVRDKILFARTCGDICHRPCEQVVNHSIPIKQLKNFVSSDSVNFANHNNLANRVANKQSNDFKVAVIGSGPAGLSSAYDLALAGYAVVIYEKEAMAGGVLNYQIPNFRMDKKGLQSEILMLEELGVRFEFGASLGEQISLPVLSEDYDAVVLAIGVGVSVRLDVIDDSISAEQHFNAMEFLQQFNEEKINLKDGSTILVIGGGNSAMDAARAAKKLASVSNVTLSCIEGDSEIPAFQDEVEEALEEGVLMITNSFVDKVTIGDDHKLELSLKAFDSKTELEKVHCDYVITAIGQ